MSPQPRTDFHLYFFEPIRQLKRLDNRSALTTSVLFRMSSEVSQGKTSLLRETLLPKPSLSLGLIRHRSLNSEGTSETSLCERGRDSPRSWIAVVVDVDEVGLVSSGCWTGKSMLCPVCSWGHTGENSGLSESSCVGNSDVACSTSFCMVLATR